MGCCGPTECVHGPFDAFSSPSRASRARSTGRAVSASPPKWGNNGESRRVATRAPRRSARDPSRVASIATGRGVSGTAPRGVASRDRRRPARRPRSTGESNSTPRLATRVRRARPTHFLHRTTHVRGLDPSRTRTPFRKRIGAFFFSLSRPASERECVASSPTDPRRITPPVSDEPTLFFRVTRAQ